MRSNKLLLAFNALVRLFYYSPKFPAPRLALLIAAKQIYSQFDPYNNSPFYIQKLSQEAPRTTAARSLAACTFYFFCRGSCCIHRMWSVFISLMFHRLEQHTEKRQGGRQGRKCCSGPYKWPRYRGMNFIYLYREHLSVPHFPYAFHTAAVEVERMLKKIKKQPTGRLFFFDQYLLADSFTHSLVHLLIMNERKGKNIGRRLHISNPGELICSAGKMFLQ